MILQMSNVQLTCCCPAPADGMKIVWLRMLSIVWLADRVRVRSMMIAERGTWGNRE